MNGYYLNQCKIPNLEEKMTYFNTIISEREKKGLSFGQIGKNFNLSEYRIRTEYKKAVKIRKWESSDLWRLLYQFTKSYPTSYAVRLYGYLLSKDISTLKSFKSTKISDICAIKGMGVKYQQTIIQMKDYLAA